MAGLGLALGGGAAAGAATLGDILKQKFLEQIQKQKLAEDIRQADLQHQTQQEQLRLGRDTLGQRGREFDVTSAQAGERLGLDKTRVGYEGEELGLKKAAEPTRLAHQVAQTEDLNRQPQEAIDARAFREKELGIEHQNRASELGISGANALRVAQQRPDKIQIVQRPDGGYVRVNLETGEEFPLKQAGKPNAAGGKVSSEYAEERQRRILHSVDALAKDASWSTVGPAAWMSGVPGTPALAFDEKVKTLKSNIAFGELAEMRAASKTGGALGQVSDKEGDLLQSTLGAVNTKMSPDQFKAALGEIKASIGRWNAAKAANAAATQTDGGGGAGAGTVQMRAPDGSVKAVAADQVEHFKSLGAVVVK